MFKVRQRSGIWSAIALMACLIFIISVGDVQAKDTLVFAEPGWDSGQVHAKIAAFIAKNGYGYGVDFIPGETIYHVFPIASSIRSKSQSRPEYTSQKPLGPSRMLPWAVKPLSASMAARMPL